MTKVIRFHETGGPDVLQYEEVEIGEPGGGEVRVKVEAIGLNRAKAMFRSGNYLEDPQLPAGIGYEGSSVVEAVGDRVDAFTKSSNVTPNTKAMPIVRCTPMNTARLTATGKPTYAGRTSAGDQPEPPPVGVAARALRQSPGESPGTGV